MGRRMSDVREPLPPAPAGWTFLRTPRAVDAPPSRGRQPRRAGEHRQTRATGRTRRLHGSGGERRERPALTRQHVPQAGLRGVGDSVGGHSGFPNSEWSEGRDSNPRDRFGRPASWPLNDPRSRGVEPGTGIEPATASLRNWGYYQLSYPGDDTRPRRVGANRRPRRLYAVSV